MTLNSVRAGMLPAVQPQDVLLPAPRLVSQSTAVGAENHRVPADGVVGCAFPAVDDHIPLAVAGGGIDPATPIGAEVNSPRAADGVVRFTVHTVHHHPRLSTLRGHVGQAPAVGAENDRAARDAGIPAAVATIDDHALALAFGRDDGQALAVRTDSGAVRDQFMADPDDGFFVLDQMNRRVGPCVQHHQRGRENRRQRGATLRHRNDRDDIHCRSISIRQKARSRTTSASSWLADAKRMLVPLSTASNSRLSTPSTTITQRSPRLAS